MSFLNLLNILYLSIVVKLRSSIINLPPIITSLTDPLNPYIKFCKILLLLKNGFIDNEFISIKTMSAFFPHSIVPIKLLLHTFDALIVAISNVVCAFIIPAFILITFCNNDVIFISSNKFKLSLEAGLSVPKDTQM